MLKTENFKDLSFFKDRDKVGKVVKNIDHLEKDINFTNFNIDGFKNKIFNLRSLRIKYFENSINQTVLSTKEILDRQK